MKDENLIKEVARILYKDAVIEAINDGESIEVIRWITDLLINGKKVSLFVEGIDTFGLLEYYESSLGCNFEFDKNDVFLK